MQLHESKPSIASVAALSVQQINLRRGIKEL